MDYSWHAEQSQKNGEPGYIWLDNARHYGRMKDGIRLDDTKVMGFNPCVEQQLEDGELCCLVETFPAKHDTYEDYIKTLEIDEILLDDLNTPGFIAKIHELYNAAVKGDDKKKLRFNQACKLIGLFNLSKKEWESSKKRKMSVSENYIIQKIEERTIAKNKGDFSLADKIREELFSKGILIEDLKDKTTWKLK